MTFPLSRPALRGTGVEDPISLPTVACTKPVIMPENQISIRKGRRKPLGLANSLVSQERWSQTAPVVLSVRVLGRLSIIYRLR